MKCRLSLKILSFVTPVLRHLEDLLTENNPQNITSERGYGTIVYQSEYKAATKILNSVYNLGLRLAEVADCTSPVLSLWVESDVGHPEHQRKFTAILNVVQVTSLPQHPCNALRSDHPTTNLFFKRPALSKLFFTAWLMPLRWEYFLRTPRKLLVTDLFAPCKLPPMSSDRSLIKIH